MVGESRSLKVAGWSAALAILLLSAPRITGLPVGASALQASDPLLGVGALALAWAWIGKRVGVIPPSKLQRASHGLLIAYSLFAVASGLWAPKLKPWLVHAGAAIYLAGIYLATTTVLAVSTQARRLFLNAWAIAFAVTSTLGVVAIVSFYLGFRDPQTNQLLTTYGSMTPGNYPRLQILFSNPNFCGSYLIVSLLILVATRTEIDPRLARALPWVSVAALASLFFTFTSGVGGLGLGAALWGWQLKREGSRRAGLLLLSSGLALAALFIAVSIVRFAPPGKGTIPLGPVDLEAAGSVRISIWGKALETYLASPIRGSGLGHPPAWVTDPKAYTPGEKWDDKLLTMNLPPHPMEAHNSYLSILAQLGTIGFALFAGFLTLLLRRVQKAPLSDRERTGILAALLGGFVYHGFFASLEEVRHVWFAFAVAGAYAFRATPTEGARSTAT